MKPDDKKLMETHDNYPSFNLNINAFVGKQQDGYFWEVKVTEKSSDAYDIYSKGLFNNKFEATQELFSNLQRILNDTFSGDIT